jgi:hypothetical protein
MMKYFEMSFLGKSLLAVGENESSCNTAIEVSREYFLQITCLKMIMFFFSSSHSASLLACSCSV